VWDVKENKKIWEVVHHQKSIVDAGFIRSCNRVVTCGLDSIVKFIDADVIAFIRTAKRCIAPSTNTQSLRYHAWMMEVATCLGKPIVA
jgi:hypothetical protein